MNQEEMIKNLQERFDLTEIKAKVIYFTLEQYFSKGQKAPITEFQEYKK